MPVERSAGAVIFRETKKGREYLLLQHAPDKSHYPLPRHPAGHWDFPKGHIEKGEKTEDAARREVREETGLSHIGLISGFKGTIRYFVLVNKEKRLKFVAFFLARADKGRVKLSFEHQDFLWLSYKEAHQKLTYANAKQVLKSAESFLRKSALS